MKIGVKGTFIGELLANKKYDGKDLGMRVILVPSFFNKAILLLLIAAFCGIISEIGGK